VRCWQIERCSHDSWTWLAGFAELNSSALERTGGSVMKTAELLGISRKTLWEKMKRLKVEATQ
jgi:DNA-binding NtrC family response regulator